MNNFHDLADINLPFPKCSLFFISSQYQTGKKGLIEKLENNNFSKDMIKHVNKFTKDNYSCKYYDKNNINSLKNYHHKSALKVIHVRIKGLAKGLFSSPKVSNLMDNIIKVMIQVCFMNKYS